MNITDEQLVEAVQGYVGGIGLRALASRYGVSHTTLSNYLRAAGVEMRDRRRSSATLIPLAHRRCTRCGRGVADGVSFSPRTRLSARHRPVCNVCEAARIRAFRAAWHADVVR